MASETIFHKKISFISISLFLFHFSLLSLLFSCLVFSLPSSLVLSCLFSLSLSRLLLSSLSVSLCLCLRVMLCVVLCGVTLWSWGCWWSWCVFGVCVCVCVCCGTLKNVEKTVWGFKNASVCGFKTSPCMPAPRVHVFQHVRVVPVHTGTF